jgi:hypothetical protein
MPIETSSALSVSICTFVLVKQENRVPQKRSERAAAVQIAVGTSSAVFERLY